MRNILLLPLFFVSLACFAQGSKKQKEKLKQNQQKIDRYIDSLGSAGALKRDPAGIGGE